MFGNTYEKDISRLPHCRLLARSPAAAYIRIHPLHHYCRQHGERDSMKCPKCDIQQEDGNIECVRCGLIFSRYRPSGERTVPSVDHKQEEETSAGRIVSYLLFTGDKVEPVYLLGRLLVFTLIVLWSIRFLGASLEGNYVGRSFMHLVNLPFHEAGHVIFRPFGSFLHSLGGSLGQLLMPLICTAVLLVKTRDPFGASVALWWTGESVLDMAPYINDALPMSLQLLGGNTGASAPYGFHDWNYILSELDLLQSHETIARLAEAGGKTVMVLALFWGLAALVRQFARLRASRHSSAIVR